VSLGIFILFNNPVQLLITAGALNGFILPISLLLVLLASYRKKIMGNYAHPQGLKIIGILVVIATLWLSIMTVIKLLE
jgi:Mn2+/Fe2+ NRAMP family transporter